jgi:hypothetical protein
MDEFLKLLTESPDNEALVKMLTRGMQGSVRSNDIGGNLLKTGLSTAGTAAFGPIGGVAGTVLGQLLVPNKQEPQPINPRVQRNLNPYGMATGGMVQNGQGLVPVEVEGDEMYELPNGQVGEFQGPDHEQGGIPTQLPPGTNVYSKRMTGADGRSMADRKESRERRLRKILAQLDKRPTDAPTINSVSREVNRIQAEEEQDMQIMQMYQLRDMLAQARQGQMQGQMSPEMMQGQMPQEMMQGEMPMMRGGGKVDPRLGTGRDMANINKVAPEVAPNQIDLIHQYHKGKGDVYQILDKAGGKRTFYRDGEELFTHPVLVGANEGDDPTMTVLNEGGGGVDWEAGNKMTGAGVFEVSKAQKRNSNYQNAPFYVYKNVATGKNIRSSDHAVLGSRRARLQDDDFTNNRMTNGCVNANCDDLKEVYNAGYGVGNRRYVLPEDGYNYFDMEDGEIVMKTRYTGGDLPEVTVTAERPSVIGMSPQLVEMPRESTAVSMPMMQAGGVIGNDPNNIYNRVPRKGAMMNPDGSQSTHLMAREYMPDKGWVAFPTLFQNEDESWLDMSNNKNWQDTYKEALKRNEVFEFGDDEQAAIEFADKGNWKQAYQPTFDYPNMVMSRDNTAINMPMMQAGGVIRNGNTMNGFTDLAMLLGGYNKMQNGGIANFDKKTGNVAGLQQFLAEQGYDMSSSRKKDGTYDGVWGKSTEAAYNDYIVTKKRERAEGAKIFDIPKLPFQIEYDNEVNRLKSLSDSESWQQLSNLDRALLESRFQRRIISSEAEERGYRDSKAYFADLVQDFDPQEMQSIIDNYEKYLEKSYASPSTEFPQEPDYLEQRRLDATETAKGLKELGKFFNMQMQSGGVIPNTQNNTGFTDLAMLLGGYNKMAAGGTTPMMSDDYINQFANYQLPVMEAGGEVQGNPPLREVLRKILQFESNHGSASGTSLPNFGKKGDAVKFENEEEALDWMMENIVPQIPEGLSTVEQLAWADFLYNSGKDPRVWAVQEYLQKYDPDSKELENGELKDRKKMFIAMKEGTYEGSEAEEKINKIYEDVMALPAKERLKLFNEGRDFYYRNITMEDEEPVKDHPLGAKSNAYQNTWFQRMKNSSTLDPYSEEVYVPYSEETAQVFNVENLDKLVETTYNPPQQDAAPDAPAAPAGGQTAPAATAQDQTTAPAGGQTAPNSQVTTASEDLDTLVELEAANPGLSVDDLITDLSTIPPITNQQDQGFSGYGIDGNLMPQTELATGIPSSEVVTDFLPNTQDAIRDEVLAQLDEYNNAEFYIRNVGNEKINKEDNESVKRAQRALQNKGYDVGPDGADGDWGPNTQKAYDQYIKDKERDLNELAQQKELLATTINAFVKGSPETTYQLESTSKTPPVDIDALLAESRTEPLPKTPEEKTEPTWKIDPLTRAGYITSGAGPLITTILNRLGDEPTPNFYANFGRDAERALDAAERGIAGSRDRAYEENRLAQNLRGRQARNAARSSNVMQAMQQAALTSGMKANEQITGQYQNALRALLANRAQFEQGQDQAVMKGREAAYTADLQNRDQFSTNLASNLANAGSMMQTLGRQKEIFDVYNQMGKSGGDATKNTLLDQLMSLYSIGGENKKDTTK